MSDDVFSSDSLILIKNGDKKAFEGLFRASCPLLVSFAYRFVRDIAIAEELVQDVYVSIWQNRAGIDPHGNFKIYLLKAVKNKALNYLKHQKTISNLLIDIELSSVEIKTPHDIMKDDEIGKAIAQSLASLPEKCRLVFALNRFDGFSYRQIAELLDISLKTVETHMGRALKHLRRGLAHLLTIAIWIS